MYVFEAFQKIRNTSSIRSKKKKSKKYFPTPLWSCTEAGSC